MTDCLAAHCADLARVVDRLKLNVRRQRMMRWLCRKINETLRSYAMQSALRIVLITSS